MAQMKTYGVFYNPAKDEDEQLVLLNTDFSILCGLFPWYFLFRRKQVALGITSIMISLLIYSIQVHYVMISVLLNYTYILAAGWLTNDLYESKLEVSGYKLKDVICATCETDAQLQYYKRRTMAGFGQNDSRAT